ncbi:MAG: twin-arginine translocase subunit TatB [Alphaproteobacteria bacterium]|nr:twin-arginine translocase subunit TatB [Alphaproteobacteria bacterium]
MFDIGWSEIFIIALLALVLLGPKEIPDVLKAVTGFIRRVRGLAGDFQRGVNQIIHETELDEVRRTLEKTNPNTITQQVQEEMGLPNMQDVPVLDKADNLTNNANNQPQKTTSTADGRKES